VENAVKNHRPLTPLEKCTITIERCFFRFLDYDGAVASVKPVIDGLIHSDIIKSDSYKVTGPWLLTQTFRPKKEGPLLKVGVSETIELQSND